MSTAGRRSERVKTERHTVTMSDFAAEIQALSAEGESNNVLIYGDSNVGKTVLAGTCPGKCFWLHCEPGYKTAPRHGARGYGRRVSDTATALAAVEWLSDKQRYKRLDWLVVDGSSTMQDRFRVAYAQEAFDIDSKTRQHRNLPDRPDYFNTQNFMKTWIGHLVDMPVNLLVTGHAHRTTSSENGELIVFPGFQGKETEVSNAITGLMDVTGYYMARKMRNRQGESKVIRRLWFDQPDEKWGGEGVRYIVGDKLNCLGPYMDFPTMPKLLEKINGGE